MKKFVLLSLIVASMLWHAVPVQAQAFLDIQSHYCYQKSNAVPDGFYDCRTTDEYIPPGYEGWLSMDHVGVFYASDPPDPTITSTFDAGAAVYAVCTWVGGGMFVASYTLASDFENHPAVAAWGHLDRSSTRLERISN